MKRVHLWDPAKRGTDEGGKNDPDLIREASVAIARFATNGTEGYWKGHPIFERVTEGRQAAQDKAMLTNPRIVPYSACGDLCHFVLRCLGVRDEALVNRVDDAGTHPWSVGANLSRMNSKKEWQAYRGGKDKLPLHGDLCQIGPEYHVFVLDEIDLDEMTCTSYDYGQWDQKKGAGGRKKVSKLGWMGGLLTIGGRTLNGWYPITAAPLVESAIVPDSFELGIIDENPYDEQRIFIDEGLSPTWERYVR